MALQDYETLDEDDFYGQPFRVEGYVSIWVATEPLGDQPEGVEPMQDWCGVGYYDLDKHEQNHEDYRPVPLRTLLEPLSYSGSFSAAAEAAAEAMGIHEVTWVMAQYDFKYQPDKVKRGTLPVAIFLGAFRYSVV